MDLGRGDSERLANVMLLTEGRGALGSRSDQANSAQLQQKEIPEKGLLLSKEDKLMMSATFVSVENFDAL